MRRNFLTIVVVFATITLIVNFIVLSYRYRNDFIGGEEATSIIFPEDAPDPSYLSKNDRITEQLNFIPTKLSERPVIIFKASNIDPEVPSGRQIFVESECPVKNCFLTSSTSFLPLAHVVYISHDEDFYPKRTDGSQIFVLRLLESPVNVPSLQFLNGQVNYTASYRWDADFVIPYGKFERGQHVLTAIDTNIIRGKTKQVAWLVSNCLTGNSRMLYAVELAKYIQVDIYGKCGRVEPSRREAERFLRKDYRFYLSFENSNCDEYVTEKFFQNALKDGVVPIVSGPSKEFYAKIAPPNSFIHIDDFETPKLLASYLLYLSRNQTAYEEYFAWRQLGSLVDTKFYCRLCALVQQPRKKVYADLDKWWHSNKCSTTSILRRG